MAEATTAQTRVAAGTEKRPKEKKVKEDASMAGTYEEQARQEIRRARRLVVDGKPTPEANFKLSVASALALLDLAGAIRENGRASANS
jgi:hypothetical protein